MRRARELTEEEAERLRVSDGFPDFYFADLGDEYKASSWGYLEDGRLVLIDYGDSVKRSEIADLFLNEKTPMKRAFLVVHDYGSGGIWAIIRAQSSDEILAKFPKLAVVDSQPEWMTEELYNSIASRNTHDIDDEPTGWLRAMR